MDNQGVAQERLSLIVSEHERIRELATAYEQGDYSTAPDSTDTEAIKDGMWTLSTEEVSPIADDLRAQMAQFDETIARLEVVSKDIDARYQQCKEEKQTVGADFAAMRKKVNGTNLSRGGWPIYAGLVVGVMGAFLANQFNLGMIASVIAGAAGYLIGNQLMQRALKRIGHGPSTQKNSVAEQAALDNLRNRYEELSREHERLTDARDYLARVTNQADDIQFAISEALHELG